MGLSLNATERRTETPHTTISYWLNGASFAELFLVEVQTRAKLFAENLEAIELQMTVQATQTVAEAMSGEMERDHSHPLAPAKNPLRYDAAVEFLRATRWKQKAGEQHKQFGS